MKNLKVKHKLGIAFGTVIALTILLSVLAMSGLRQIKGETDVLVSKSLTNTEYVWELRRNMTSEARYDLLALVEKDPAKSKEYLQKGVADFDKNQIVWEKYKENCTIDKSKLDELDDIFNHQKQYRDRFVSLMNAGTEEAKSEAYVVFMNEFYPLVGQQGQLLREMGEMQSGRVEEQITRVNKVYVGVLSIVVVSVLASIAVALVMVAKILKAITVPLNQIQDATNALAKGDFSVNISYDSKDEFGVTCQKIQESFAELKRIISATAYGLGEVAEGNFAVEPVMNFPGEMEQIETAQMALIEQMNSFFEEIKSSANQIHAGSEQVSSGAQALAQGATEQASSLQQLSASITEISENVTDNAQNAKKANEMATLSGEVAQATMQDMQEMLEAMNKISQSAQSIGKVIKVIDDITFQTNILSLNAAVEAARAGVAGKGFAVVADEVRNLAQKSSESAKEIATLIEGTILSVNQGESIAGKTSTAFNDLAEKIEEVITTVNEIAIASDEQSKSIQQITLGVEQISAVVQTNSATSEESAAASEELSGQANMLNELVGHFKLKSDADSADYSNDRGIYREPVHSGAASNFDDFDSCGKY